MRKNFLSFVLFLLSFVCVLIKTSVVHASEEFNMEGFSFRVSKEAEENGIGEVEVIGIDSDFYDNAVSYIISREKVIIPESVEYNEKKYIVSGIQISFVVPGTKKESSTIIFKNLKYLELPESLKSFDCTGMRFIETSPVIVFKSTISSIKNIENLYYDESSINGAIVYAPYDELELYQKKMDETVVFSVSSASDLGEREGHGIFVYPIGAEDVQPKYFYSTDGKSDMYHDITASYSAFFEVIDRDNHYVKCIDFQRRDKSKDEPILYIPEKVYFNGIEYKVKVLGRFSTIGLNMPLALPDGITELEPESISGNIIALYLPDSIRNLPSDLFCGDIWNLKYIKLPSSLKKLPKKIFQNCLDLNSISIPKKVKKIGYKAFGKNIKTIYFEGKCPKSLSSAFSRKKRTIVYVLPDHLDDFERHLYADNIDNRILLRSCLFRKIRDLDISMKSIFIEKNSEYSFTTYENEKNTDLKLLWMVNLPENGINISQKGILKTSQRLLEGFIYVIDVISGKMSSCKLIPND